MKTGAKSQIATEQKKRQRNHSKSSPDQAGQKNNEQADDLLGSSDPFLQLQ